MNILVINPGSTSTKVALFSCETERAQKKINHTHDELSQFETIRDELPMRIMRVKEFIDELPIKGDALHVVVGRGGMLPPVRHGAYVVDKALVNTLLDHPVEQHASNLGAGIAYEIATEYGIPAYIYDSVSVDELEPLARLSGVKGYDRRSFSHVLNTRAVARKVADRESFDLLSSNVIVAHLGGGISLNLQSKGQMIDVVSADEGPFSTERAGGLPIFTAVQIARNEGIDALYDYETGKGGLLSYTGSNDAIAIEQQAASGDAYMALLFEALSYQVAKAIGGLATVVDGDLQAIILTGGMAHSKRVTNEIEKRVRFMAPVHVFPGELEMEALALGALRVMQKEEEAFCFLP